MQGGREGAGETNVNKTANRPLYGDFADGAIGVLWPNAGLHEDYSG
ncbi:MAG: hypothetical protein AMXMBFR82_50360 [Candidatus Hydrogenedentota bacterium]